MKTVAQLRSYLIEILSADDSTPEEAASLIIETLESNPLLRDSIYDDNA